MRGHGDSTRYRSRNRAWRPAECATGFEAVQAVANPARSPLLTSKMPLMDPRCWSLIEKDVVVVFVMAYDQHYSRLSHAVDYLLAIPRR